MKFSKSEIINNIEPIMIWIEDILKYLELVDFDQLDVDDVQEYAEILKSQFYGALEGNKPNWMMKDLYGELKEEPRTSKFKNNGFYNIDDVCDFLDCSKTFGYKIIKQLNQELENQNYITMQGKVSAQYFNERFYRKESSGDNQ